MIDSKTGETYCAAVSARMSGLLKQPLMSTKQELTQKRMNFFATNADPTAYVKKLDDEYASVKTDSPVAKYIEHNAKNMKLGQQVDHYEIRSKIERAQMNGEAYCNLPLQIAQEALDIVMEFSEQQKNHFHEREDLTLEVFPLSAPTWQGLVENSITDHNSNMRDLELNSRNPIVVTVALEVSRV
jgi:hypothetical protein